jgi:cytochrome c2
VPWASISEAPEWRSSCGCQWPRPAACHSFEKSCEKLSGPTLIDLVRAKNDEHDIWQPVTGVGDNAGLWRTF